VLAPSSVAECFTLTREAFTLAVRFQCPVIVLTDKEINLTTATVSLGDPTYQAEPEAIIPVPPPFGAGIVRRSTGSTHDERGYITKDKNKIQAMNSQLWNKIMDHQEEIERVQVDDQPAAETLFVSYGVTARSMEAALPLCRKSGKRVSSAKLHSLWPVPAAALTQAAQGVKRIVIGELNPGLYAREIRCLFPSVDIVSLQRIDGGMIRPDDFANASY